MALPTVFLLGLGIIINSIEPPHGSLISLYWDPSPYWMIRVLFSDNDILD